MRLIAIQLPSLPAGLGSPGNVRVDDPPHVLRGWKISVRGAAVFLISPAGWRKPGDVLVNLDPKGERRVFEIPRSDCVLQWEGDGAVDGLTKYDSESMDRPKVVAIDDAELEAMTAPKAKAK